MTTLTGKTKASLTNRPGALYLNSKLDESEKLIRDPRLISSDTIDQIYGNSYVGKV